MTTLFSGPESLLKTIFGFGGYGVQLFFVASAMTLCMSLENNYGKSRWLMKYIVRRYFRIAPMYYLGRVLYFCVWRFFFSVRLSMAFGSNQFTTPAFLHWRLMQVRLLLLPRWRQE